MINDAGGVALGVRVGFGFVVDLAGDAEGGSVKWGLRNKTVREGNAEEAGNSGGEAKKEDIPVEACGFAKGKFGALSYKGGDYRRVSVVFEKERYDVTAQVVLELKPAMLKQTYDKDLHQSVCSAKLRALLYAGSLKIMCTDMTVVRTQESRWTTYGDLLNRVQ